jgi:NADH dehydrogenase
MTRRIVVVGAGFAGMWSALAAARVLHGAGEAGGSVEIVLIAPEPFLHIRPRFYEPNPAAMKAPLEDVFEAVGVRYAQGAVERIRADEKEVEAKRRDGSRFAMSYDRLVLAAGSELFRPEIPGLREHAFSVDQLEEAAELESHLVALAALPDAPARNRVVVAGGGFTGIEIAAEMPARLRSILGDAAGVEVISWSRPTRSARISDRGRDRSSSKLSPTSASRCASAWRSRQSMQTGCRPRAGSASRRRR